MKKITTLFKNNKELFNFMALSYFDKAVIFLLPILVLQLFKDQSIYLAVEYIYSVTIVVIPFLDLGLGGYFYYVYRNGHNKRATILSITKSFQILYSILFLVGVILVGVHYFIIAIDEYIIYIIPRALFLATFAFLSSYYRLIGKPHKSLFISILANILSLSLVFLCATLKMNFELWLIFAGQILFCFWYFVKITKQILVKWPQYYAQLDLMQTAKDSLLFSWPTIMQGFIIMYVANYGKINVMDKMSLDDGTLLSLVQRFGMLIQLTHTSIVAFIIKDIYTLGNEKEVEKNIMLKYIGLLTVSTIVVFLMVLGYFEFYNYNFSNFMFVLVGIIAYTYFWCLASYLEVYYSRENKNIFKLYLACINGFIFVSILFVDSMGYLEKIIIAMCASTLITLIISVLFLKKRGYHIS